MCVCVESHSKPVLACVLECLLHCDLPPVEVNQVRAASITRSSAVPRAPRGVIARKAVCKHLSSLSISHKHLIKFGQFFRVVFQPVSVCELMLLLLFIVMIMGCATGRLSLLTVICTC